MLWKNPLYWTQTDLQILIVSVKEIFRSFNISIDLNFRLTIATYVNLQGCAISFGMLFMSSRQKIRQKHKVQHVYRLNCL